MSLWANLYRSNHKQKPPKLNNTLSILNVSGKRPKPNKIDGTIEDLNPDYIAYEMFKQLKNCLYLWKYSRQDNKNNYFHEYFKLAPNLFELIGIKIYPIEDAESLYQKLFSENKEVRQQEKNDILYKYREAVERITNALKPMSGSYLAIHKKVYNYSLNGKHFAEKDWAIDPKYLIARVRLGEASIFSIATGEELDVFLNDIVIGDPKDQDLIEIAQEY